MPEDTQPQNVPKPDETVKETFESIIIAFILAFVFRAFVVEAFVIPTGSMAPTLLGEHIRVQCADCGYKFDAEAPSNSSQKLFCPMSGHPIPLPSRVIRAGGDRILVHKYIYRFSEPRRWDVVVFKNPADPKINYIKRLVGLPSESLYLFEGNVYTCEQDASGEPLAGKWKIARKTDRPKVQRAVWRPIYYSDYVPVDPKRSLSTNMPHTWRRPWQPAEASAWDMTRHGGRSYHYTGQGDGTIEFAFIHWRRNIMQGLYSYNQLHYPPSWRQFPEPVEDIRLVTTVEPGDAETPLRLELRTTGRLDAGPVPIAAVIEKDGQVRVIVGDPTSDQVKVFDGDTITPLADRTATEVEFWFVDQEASVWVDGEKVLEERFDYPMETLKQRPYLGPVTDPNYWPKIALHVEGGPATLHHVQLDRDLYYSGHGMVGDARGGLLRVGRRWTDHRLDISADEFFCIGDNGPLSHDGRYWGKAGTPRTNPWIVQRMFAGDRSKDGIVPRDLMMGRAFFVYLPALYPMKKNGYSVLLNFGDMRFIH